MDRISRIKELLNVEEIKEMKSFQNKWLDEGRYIGQISIAKVMLKSW